MYRILCTTYANNLIKKAIQLYILYKTEERERDRERREKKKRYFAEIYSSLADTIRSNFRIWNNYRPLIDARVFSTRSYLYEHARSS